jgi:hypothetical protein
VLGTTEQQRLEFNLVGSKTDLFRTIGPSSASVSPNGSLCARD